MECKMKSSKSLPFFIIILGYFCQSVAQQSTYKSYEQYSYFKLNAGAHEPNLTDILQQMGGVHSELIYESTKDVTMILVPKHEVDTLSFKVQHANLKKLLVTDDFSRLLEAERPNVTTSGDEFDLSKYNDIDELQKYFRNLSKKFPNSAELIFGGRTTSRKKIVGVRVHTNKNRKDRKAKPVIVIAAGSNARQWITIAAVTYFMNKLLTSGDPKVISLRNDLDWHIFPVINPNGYLNSFSSDRMWRKSMAFHKDVTCYGVDLNRNWDYRFSAYGSSKDPCNYHSYFGTHAFSELETRSFSTYLFRQSQKRRLKAYLSFSAYDQAMYIPFSDTATHKGNYKELVQIGHTVNRYLEEANFSTYYEPKTYFEHTRQPVSGMSIDWVKEHLNTPIVMEIALSGTEFIFLPSQIPMKGKEIMRIIMGIADEGKNLGYL